MIAEDLRGAYEERVRLLGQEIASRDLWLSTLSAVAARTHGCDETQEILDIALEEVLSRLDLTAGWIFMGDQADRKLHFAASRGVSQEYLNTVERVGLAECLCPEVFWSGHRMQARNTTQCPRMPTILDGLQQRVAHACVPLRFEGQTRGVLNVAARAGQLFSEDELMFFETLGRQVCVAIERARHIKAERQRNLEAHAIADVNKAIGGSLELSEVLKAVGCFACSLLSVDRAQVLLGSDPSNMTVANLSGLPHPELNQGERLDLVALSARGHRFALETRTVLQSDNWLDDPRVDNSLASRWDIASGIVVPLVSRGSTLGLMVLTRREPRPWTASQIELAEAFATQACVAIDNAHLYEESTRAFDDLKAAQDRMLQAEKMAVLGTFASGLAHEIRNPLNSISLQLSILERRIRRIEPDTPGEMSGVTEIIRTEISRLDSLVSDFLLFSRGNRLHRSMNSVDDLVDDVVRLLTPEAEENSIELLCRHASPERAPGMMLDPERIKQVVINLIRNSFDAIKRSGRVTLCTEVGPESVRLVVEDTGPGLPPGIDIFQLFVTTKAKGTGLGLAIAQQIVSDHGGTITAANAPHGGASFVISLPRHDAAPKGD